MCKKWSDLRAHICHVINGLSVLCFLKPGQGFTGSSMRMAHAQGQKCLFFHWEKLQLFFLGKPGLKCQQYNIILEGKVKFKDGKLRLQMAPGVIIAHYYLILLFNSTNRVISHITEGCVQSHAINSHMLRPVSF